MRELEVDAARSVEPEEEPVPAWLKSALHELAQPLCALQLVLYLGCEADGKGGTGPHDQREQCLREAQVQCARMQAMVRAMQRRMIREP